jgi:beta-1,2-mannobiose phosphorylase / 1,2-beta-oligomannan phosphorylase
MREYALGALLLDIDDPCKVIGHLEEPLLVPNDEERDGYVPNVVYSCGSVVHNDHLMIAYGASDTSAGFARVSVDALLSELT